MAKALKEAARTQTVTVVVRNLPVGITQQELRAICESSGEVVEVEIPARTARFTHFIYGFVRFADLEAARAAVKKLSGMLIGNRSLNAQIAREHWRNSNDATVTRVGAGRTEEEEQEDEETRNMTEGEIRDAVLRECRRQWQQHRRRHPDRDLPSFESILETVSCLSTSTEVSLEKDLN